MATQTSSHSVEKKMLVSILTEIMASIGKKKTRKITPSFAVTTGQDNKPSQNQRAELLEITLAWTSTT